MKTRDPFSLMRQVGKAWATAVASVKPAPYFKEGRTRVTGPVFCRGGRRAHRRRLYRAAIRAAAAVRGV